MFEKNISMILAFRTYVEFLKYAPAFLANCINISNSISLWFNIDGNGWTDFQNYCHNQCLNTTLCSGNNGGSGNNTGNSKGTTGNHIHFEVNKDSLRLNLQELRNKNGVIDIIDYYDNGTQIDGIDELNPSNGMISSAYVSQNIVSTCSVGDGMTITMGVPTTASVDVFGNGIMISSYEVFTWGGQPQEDGTFNPTVNTFTMNTSTYASGWYAVRVIDDNGNVYSHPFYKP